MLHFLSLVLISLLLIVQSLPWCYTSEKNTCSILLFSSGLVPLYIYLFSATEILTSPLHFLTRWSSNYLFLWLNSWIWDQILFFFFFCIEMNQFQISDFLNYMVRSPNSSFYIIHFTKSKTELAVPEIAKISYYVHPNSTIRQHSPYGGQLWLPEEMQYTKVYSLSAANHMAFLFWLIRELICFLIFLLMF